MKPIEFRERFQHLTDEELARHEMFGVDRKSYPETECGREVKNFLVEQVRLYANHLQDLLTWRLVADEEPRFTNPNAPQTDVVLYVVDGFGLCVAEKPKAPYHTHPYWYDGKRIVRMRENHLYRPAISGIDFVQGAV